MMPIGREVSSRDTQRVGAMLVASILIYVLAAGFEGFWLAGADFFSDGHDAAVQAAIGVWWGVLLAAIFLWRLPAITIVASAASLIARAIWIWPKYLRIGTAAALLFGGTPDLAMIAASCGALAIRFRISNLPK
jgi:hypothetical protein